MSRCAHVKVELSEDHDGWRAYSCQDCGTVLRTHFRSAVVQHVQPRFTDALLWTLAVVVLPLVLGLYWSWVSNRDAHLDTVAVCANAAVAGQDYTQDQWRAAWDACWTELESK